MTSSASVSNNQMRKDKKHRVMRCFFMNIKGILPGAVSGTKNYNFAGMRKSRDDTGDVRRNKVLYRLYEQIFYKLGVFSYKFKPEFWFLAH